MKKIIVFIVLALFQGLVGSLAWSQAVDQELVTAFEEGETAKILDLLAADPGRLKADLEDGMTPLHFAAYYGYVPVVDYALKHGVDVNVRDRRGLTPVWFTVSGKRPAMLRKLAALGADLSIKNPQGDDMLFRAATAGDAEVFGFLLEKGFKADAKNAFELTPLMYAARADSVDVMKLLAARGLKLESATDPSFTLLHHAVFGREARAVHYLLDNGADIDARHEGTGMTPLFLAVDFGNPEAARALVMRGANLDAADKIGQTPLEIALKKGRRETVELLLARGANAETVDARTGKSLLHEAALRGYSGIVESLIARGVAKNAKDRDGRTALSYALKYGNRTAAEVLRKNGVEDVPWESSLDAAPLLWQPLKAGEARIWYLKHSGWAVRTKSAFLVFDYWDEDAAPDEKLLANGHIRPEELKGLPVYVFVTHEHGDHFDRQILEWRKVLPGATYVFGFEPRGIDGVVSMAPRTQKRIGPLDITTIRANDAGVGFAVTVDGLTIFHAGDHANNTVEMAGNDFFPEIDFLAEKRIRPDIAFFLNMYGCGSTNPEAFKKGIYDAIGRLRIKAVLPMHAAGKEWVYQDLVESVAKDKVRVQVGAAVNQGDRFFFRKGKLI